MTDAYHIATYVNSARIALKSLVYDYDMSIVDRLNEMAAIYHRLYQENQLIAYVLVSNYHPKFLGAKKETLVGKRFSLDDFRATVAAEHGYQDWVSVSTINDQLDTLFESTVDAITYGNQTQLEDNLRLKPSLVTQCSQFGHKATLLHYIAANGVPLYRQSIGYNAPDLARLLLVRGAKKDAKMNVYGGQFSTIDLMLTSAHPQEAGLVDELSEILSY